jgi:membrane protease YdiL (CAAX protease family)
MSKSRVLPDFLQVPWGIRDVLFLIIAWFGLQALIGELLILVARGLPPVATFLKAAQSGDIGASFVLDILAVGVGLGVVYLYLRKFGVGWSAVGWRKVGILRTAKYLFGIMLIFIILANLAFIAVKFLVPGFNANQAQTNDFTSSVTTHRSLALVALVLVPPIFEETIFRGFIFPALSKKMGIIWGAILSSVIFGIAHGQPNLFVYTTILGLLLCFMYRRTGSIIPGIMLHMLNNLLAFVAISSK